MVLGLSSGPCELCWVRFVVRAWQKSAVICPTSEPKFYNMTSTEPINSMLISFFIFWHVQMVIINGFGVVIWSMWVMLGQICGQGVTKISCDLPNFWSKILPDDIHWSNQFHAHQYHHLLTCQDGDNQWFWGCHLAHVSHAGSDLWSGCDKNQLKLKFAQLARQNPARRHPQSQSIPCSSMPSSLDMPRWW